ncbi:type VI secretion system tube protein TssD [Edaphobacter aggregans]|uniref:type VI secretion system tube protein TssD n=1 Tax=Edaphobacter aggregans TaxID=570835 RepID=UPI000557BD67|nr:type VI secretion system tube protein TssD [Edaphobacter aggregans]
MPTQIFATVTGAKQGAFKGESPQKGREGKIAGVAFAYGVAVPRDAASGQVTGKRQHNPVVFTKEWGASSPQFYAAAYTNEVLPTVLFEFYSTSPTGTQVVDHTIKLTNATIIEIDQSLNLPQAGGPVIDSRELQAIAFTFQKIEITSLTGGTSAADA